MKEWKTYTLEEICTGKGTYGIGASAVAYDSSKYTYLRITDINDDGTLNKGELKSVDDEEAYKYILQKNDIVFARTGNSTGRSYFYDGTDGELVYAGFLIKFSLDPSKVNPRIMKYYTHSQDYYDWVKSFDTGGTRGNINAKTYGLMPITLPPRGVQDKIVEVLKSIDEKIELNKRINDNLEKQAQALYKSWFVDFEPFCEGEFIESSLGSIPAGWKVGQLSDICEIVGGGTPPKSHPEYYCKRGIAWITPKDLSVSKSKFSSRGSEDITSDGYKNSSAKLMPRGTVLFSSRAPIGYISIATNEICTNQGFKSAVPGIAGTGYLYYFLQANTDKIESKASGSTFKEASGSLMRALEVIIPTDGIFNQFEAELALILTKQENIASEIQTLTALRDTLLPKLISGELKINELDC